jgi:hypothetical protein
MARDGTHWYTSIVHTGSGPKTAKVSIGFN